MKVASLFSVFLFYFQVNTVTASVSSVFRPYRITYEDLLKDGAEGFSKEAFTDALTTVGMISVTGIFPSSKTNQNSKEEILSLLHYCLVESDDTQEHIYRDGTVRRTLATKAVSGTMFPFGNVASRNSHDSCRKFFDTTDDFRNKISEVTSLFSKKVASILDVDEGSKEAKPLLLLADGNVAINSIAEVVEMGEHLEHFHSYQKPVFSNDDSDKTIEWHTDQGLFIAFTPARQVSQGLPTTEALTEGFYVELNDGTQALVQFDDDDDLVFMLGDGVNQYINSRSENVPKLRATPHAVVMPEQNEGEARVWYGRMVLPPPNAIHPDHGITFQDVRHGMIHGSIDNYDFLSLGCSVHRRANEDENEECASADEMYCWHRCQSISLNNVSEAICSGRGLQLQCINPRGQISDGSHGDYFPGCVALDAVIATPLPLLPDAPRDNETCTSSSWELFNAESGFDHEFELPNRMIPNGTGAMLMWSIVDDEIHGRLSFNGLFGWLAFGFADPEGAKNGMHGSKLIMALPGGNYSAATGLDLSLGTQIDNYMISDNKDQSAFRWWQTPIVSTTRSLTGNAKIEETDCFTALYFNASSIADISFNLTGVDDLIWGGNGADYFVGYHGGQAARFTINWVEGSGQLFVPPTSAPSPPVPAEKEDVVSAPVSAPVAVPTSSNSAPTSAASTFSMHITSVVAAGLAVSNLLLLSL